MKPSSQAMRMRRRVAAALDLDIAFWLTSLYAEARPAPEAILPDSPGFAAWVAGFFCARAGQPPIADAPHVRALQLRQAATALPWAARALGCRTVTGPVNIGLMRRRMVLRAAHHAAHHEQRA